MNESDKTPELDQIPKPIIDDAMHESPDFALALMLCHVADKVDRCKKCEKDDKGNVKKFCARHKKQVDELEARRKARNFSLGGQEKE